MDEISACEECVPFRAQGKVRGDLILRWEKGKVTTNKVRSEKEIPVGKQGKIKPWCAPRLEEELLETATAAIS